MRKHIVTIIAITMVVALVIPTACATRPAEFELGALNISPSEVISGEATTVTADVENIGGSEGTHTATLKIDGVEVETKGVTVAPGAKETVTFSVTKEAAGNYQIGVDGLTGTLRVLKPAEFTVSDLIISPTEPEVWEEVTVTATVENIGEAEGTYTASFKIDGEEVETQDVAVAGGATETVAFTFMRDVGPSCDIEINGLTQTVALKEGVLPTWSIGDRWVSQFTSEGIEYAMTLEVTSEGVTDGRDCYVVEGSFEPPLMGYISSLSAKMDKATMYWLRMQMLGEVMDEPFIIAFSYSYEFPGALLYPLEVGKEIEVIETETTTITAMGETQTETVTSTYTYKVEKIEEITVLAGTFRCFKLVKYDEAGTAVSTHWTSDKVKQFDVKSIDHIPDEVTELVSYSVS